MNAKNVVVHLGYPKAASTTFQRDLLAGASGIVNLGLCPTGNVAESDDAFRSCENTPYALDASVRRLYELWLNEPTTSFRVLEARRLWHELEAKYGHEGANVVLSHEAFLSARFCNPSFFEKISNLFKTVEASRLRFLILIRRQDRMLASLYRDHPFDPLMLERRAVPVSFTKWVHLDAQRPYGSHHDALKYGQVYDFLKDCVGEKDVTMLPLELLQHDMNRFCDEVAHCLGIVSERVKKAFTDNSSNTGMTKVANRYRRLKAMAGPVLQRLGPVKRPLHGFDERLDGWLMRVGRTERLDADASLEQHFAVFYRQDNQRLEIALGLPLDQMGYPV